VTAFRDLPIRRKLLLVTLAPAAAALLLVAVGFLAWDVTQMRREIRNDVLAQARIVSEAGATALEFDDQRVARETLAALALRPLVRLACFYDAGERLFEGFRRDAGTSCPAAPPPETAFGWAEYEVVWPVVSGTARVGTLYIGRELTDVTARLRFGAATVLALLLLAILVASSLARGMQRAIAAPMLALADMARRVSTTRDYSLRATAQSRDETGVVVHAFNDMLDRIGAQTAELSKTNDDLAREIEERRRVERERTEALERERDANRLKDEFLATLSHELRTPLNAVLGWTRVLRSARLEPATEARALESIERNARAQARLIEDLLEVSRIVTGKLRLQIRDTDLAAIVDAAAEIVRPAAAAKRLAMRVDVGVRPAMTAGDPDRLQQVVWNLLSNAVKFTPAGGEVTVRLARDAGYRLTVEDSGPGIDPRFLPYVFEPFRQADGTASREHGGLGLGLAIAKQLVELHGGTIEARSRGTMAGAAFEVALPSVVAAPPPEPPGVPEEAAAAAAPAEPTLLRNVRVLVVDDEEDARVLMQTALTQYGAEVTTAASVAEAFAALDDAAPDVVLSDIGMPHEDGFSLIHQLRDWRAARGASIPAIAVTAYASARDRSATAAAGYAAHIAKPFEPADVARLIADLSRQRRREMPKTES
jgi:signal transduction histidine kinase/ActR/RegA family two-component response regulator